MTMHIPTFTGPMTLPVFPETRRDMLVRVIQECAIIHGVDPHRITGPERHRHIARARWDVWLILRDAGWKLTEIARSFKRDHTTIMHGISKARARRAEA